MALSDRDIIITPNRGASTEPTILFRGADASTSASITLRVLNSGTIGTLSFEGVNGQLLSLTDTFTGSIFAVNDVSGIPSIEVLDSGAIRLAHFNGGVSIGSANNATNATSTSTGVLTVAGGAGIWKDLYIGGNINIAGTVTAGSIATGAAVTSATNVTITNDPSSGGIMYPTFVNATSGIAGIRVDNDGLSYVPSTNRLGVGTNNPSTNLHVYGASDPVITLQAGGGSYPYIQLTTPSSGTGYLIKNLATGNSILNQSFYMWNSSGPIQFVPSATPANSVTIDTSGRVGIGTGAAPTLYTPLNVGSASHYSPTETNRTLHWWGGTGGTELYNSAHLITAGNSSSDTVQPQAVGLHLFNTSTGNNTWSPILVFGGLSTSGGYISGAAGIAAQLISNTSDSNFRGGDLHFYINNATDANGRGFAGSATSRVVFKGNGNNGFGTTSPATKLHLQSSGDTILRIDSTNSVFDPQILLTDNNNPTGEGTRILYDSSVGDTYFNNVYTLSTNAFHFQSGAFGSGTELLTITTAGNLLKKNVVVPSLTVSDTAPGSPFDGDLWWESDTGRLKVRYNDGSSVQWVDAMPIPNISNLYSKAGGPITGNVTISGTLDVNGLASFNNVYVAGTVTAGSIVGSISASTIAVTNDSSTAASFYPTFVSGTGTPALKVDTSKFIYRPSDGRLTLSSGIVAPSGIFGATTGAPDARIWAISADQYPNWGLFYNEGSPDYIEFQSGGTVTSRICLDSGDAHFGLTGGYVGINQASPATRLNITQGAGDSTYGTAVVRIGGTGNYASLELGIKGAYDGMISTYGNDLHIYAGNWRGVGNAASENHTIYFYTSQSGSTNWNTPKWQMQSTGQLIKGSYAVPSIAISDTPPGSSMFDGDFWWESDTGKLKIRYNDGSSTQWVDAMPVVDTTQFYPRAGGTILGTVGISQSLTVGQWITAGGEITAYYSDRRLKTNVAPIQNALGKVLKLNGITYNPNEVAAQYGYDTNVNIVGLFADEVADVLPEAVKPAPFDTDEEGNSKSGENYKTVQYEKLVPLLVEAMKDQQKIIDGLQTKITELEKLIGKSN